MTDTDLALGAADVIASEIRILLAHNPVIASETLTRALATFTAARNTPARPLTRA